MLLLLLLMMMMMMMMMRLILILQSHLKLHKLLLSGVNVTVLCVTIILHCCLCCTVFDTVCFSTVSYKLASLSGLELGCIYGVVLCSYSYLWSK